MRVEGLWFRVKGLKFRLVQGFGGGLGFKVPCVGFRVRIGEQKVDRMPGDWSGEREQSFGFRILSMGFGAEGLGFRV